MEYDHLFAAIVPKLVSVENTSLEGFRKALLQRSDILKIDNDKWLLQVEKETYDVILDRLPWSLQVIKLPWMAQALCSICRMVALEHNRYSG
ncbi:MAG: contractile injection system tape measure protein [Leptolyngbyaceae cyanobacterium]